MRRELSVLPPIPSIWLDGRYLSSPSDYPEVREVWAQYLRTVRGLRSEEAERYGTAYVSALDDARVTGPTRTLRLASAVSAFEDESAPRDAHYTRVIELASSALALHDLLVGLEGSITYEPAAGPGLSADPVLQAAGVDEETQNLLDDALDRVLDALSAEGVGPVEAERVPEWLFDGLQEAVEP
jgi:hypothetical protein